MNTEIKVLRERLGELRREARIVDDWLYAAELAEARRAHCCPCVMLNKDIGIGTMAEQEAAGRNGIGHGFVSHCLSAVKACVHCGGTGVPKGKCT